MGEQDFQRGRVDHDQDRERDRRRDDPPQEQARAHLQEALHEPRPGVDPDDCDEDVEAERIHQPHRGRRNVADRRIDGA